MFTEMRVIPAIEQMRMLSSIFTKIDAICDNRVNFFKNQSVETAITLNTLKMEGALGGVCHNLGFQVFYYGKAELSSTFLDCIKAIKGYLIILRKEVLKGSDQIIDTIDSAIAELDKIISIFEIKAEPVKKSAEDIKAVDGEIADKSSSLVKKNKKK